MNPFLVSNIRKTLNTPLDFQEKYGNHPQEIKSIDLPRDSWRSLTLRGWKFKDVDFNQTIFLSDTFENVEFEGCLFDRVEFRKNVFKNCSFVNCGILSGSWEGNSFINSSLNDIQFHFSPQSNFGITWENQTFENTIFNLLAFGDRAGDWTNCRFNLCKLTNSNFSPIQFKNPEFRQCILANNAWYGVNTGVTEGVFGDSHILNNDFANTSFNASFIRCKISGGTGITSSGSFIDGETGDVNGGIELGKVINSTLIGKVNSVLITEKSDKSVISNVSGTAFILNKGGENLLAENMTVVNLSLSNGDFRECSFRNINASDLFIGNSHFEGCRFENLHITRRIYMPEPATFTNCTFVNFRRDPQVEVAGDQDVAIPGYLFPFESAPGVNKP